MKYQINYTKNLHYLIAIILFVAFIGWDVNNANKLEVHAQVQLEEENVELRDSTVVSTPQAIYVSEPTPALEFATEVQAYVYEVFGDDYEKAFEIVNCESKWNEKAFNDNTTWGGIGQDRGIWQINNVFHPVSDECAYDYKCSTTYAFRMYTNDDQTFRRWTCGNYDN